MGAATQTLPAALNSAWDQLPQSWDIPDGEWESEELGQALQRCSVSSSNPGSAGEQTSFLLTQIRVHQKTKRDYNEITTQDVFHSFPKFMFSYILSSLFKLALNLTTEYPAVLLISDKEYG